LSHYAISNDCLHKDHWFFGLETVRVRSQHATMARYTLSSIAVLLIAIAGTRRKRLADKPQQLPMFELKKPAYEM